MTRAFEAANISSPAIDARFLLQGVLGWDATIVLRDGERPVGDGAYALTLAAQRRLAHEPVARILGQREFYGRPFRVTPDVLDPRPDTETLIDLVLDVVRGEPRFANRLTFADIGVGSGAIIATLLAELPHATGIGTDVSPAALAIAAQNAATLGVADRLTLVETGILTGILTSTRAKIDIVVSNPPYIPSAEIAGLAVDVRAFDPHLALDGGLDGLDVYREIARDISALGRACWVCLELGAGQAADVEAIFAAIGGEVRLRRQDLGGHTRAVALEIHC